MRSSLPRNANALELRGGEFVEPALAFGQPAEHIVVMHHGFTVAAQLHIDLDAVIAGDGRAHGAGAILDQAAGGVVQSAMGDGPGGEPVERGPH